MRLRTIRMLCYIGLFLGCTLLGWLVKLNAQGWSGYVDPPLPGISEGVFSRGVTAPTLILLNDTSVLSDAQTAAIAGALSARRGVNIATRLSGSVYCNAGEWCLDLRDAMFDRVADPAARGALVGDAVMAEIVKASLR